jgi:hypothetical protein
MSCFSQLFRQLQNIQRGLDFAENFGELEKSDTKFGQISLMSADAKGSFSLTGYQKNEQSFVIHSSQNPANYFVLPDSIARQIFCNPIADFEKKSVRENKNKTTGKAQFGKKK